jgi:hypothetical protein
MSVIHMSDGSVVVCDDNRHDTYDQDGEELHPDDAQLAKAVADAVCDALRSRRKGGDSRKARDAEPTERERQQMFDESQPDHRRDFSPLNNSAAKDQALRRASLAGGYGYAGARDSAMVDLDAMFAAPRTVSESVDLDGMFGGRPS